MDDQRLPERWTVELDPCVYRLTAIKKAAYRFSGKYAALIEPLPTGKIRVVLSGRLPIAGTTSVVDAFLSEALDQELREIVGEETRSTRDILLAQAFSGLALLDPGGEHADYLDDPLGVEKRFAQQGQGHSVSES